MRTQLFIENKEVELNEDVQFLLNKQFEELDNPTVIINDYSKTVTIPFTEANNRLFGYIYKPERMIVDDGTPDSYKQMNVYFDPYKKLDFKLVYNSTVVMEGYAKMNKIKRDGETGTYEITLYGQLGKLFYDMKKITFDKTYDDPTYIINGEQYVDEYINRNLVSFTWSLPSQTSDRVHKKHQIGYNICDIIGFAPNNSFSNDFDYKTFEYNNEGLNFTKVLEDVNFKDSTGLEPDTVIKDGLLPREIGEYRSYLQLPYIYWNKLFQIFQEKAEQVTGYDFVLDSSFFNTNNPDWFNLVYILKPLVETKGNEGQNSYTYSGETIEWTSSGGTSNYSTSKDIDLTLTSKQETYERYDTSTGYIDLINNDFLRISDNNFDFNIKGYVTGIGGTVYFNADNCLAMKLKVTGSNGHYSEKIIVVYRDGTTNAAVLQLASAADAAVPVQAASTLIGDRQGWHVTVNAGSIGILPSEYGDYIYLETSARWLNENNPIGTGTAPTHVIIELNSYQLISTLRENYKRSFSKFILNDLWNNEYNIFNEILKYCKKHRILIYSDDYERKLYFTPATKYFENYSIIDWTDKLDLSKDMTIVPITLENKYVLFNYDDNDTELGKEYKEKYGYDFGEYRLTTEYNFNEDTKELFDGCKTSMTNTDNVLSWNTLYYNKDVAYSFGSELFIYNKDKNKKQVDTFGCFYFQNGLGYFDTSLNLREVNISDDTEFQMANNTYFYTQNNDYMITKTTYPKLDIVKNNNICLFNTPKENYTYNNNYSGKSSIFDRYWSTYINERYDLQNKIMTCWINLTPIDFMNFEYKNFVKIEDQIYFVHKIYDYNIEDAGSTKVDLISIQDPDAYTR